MNIYFIHEFDNTFVSPTICGNKFFGFHDFQAGIKGILILDI
jgi:hypothetical protein